MNSADRDARVGAAPGRALVVGAGIAGLTTALLLSRAGRSVTVLERAGGPADLGAGIMLQPNGLAVLDGLGLRRRVEAAGRPVARMDIRNAAGRLVASQAVPALGADLSHSTALRRSDLHRVLLDAVNLDRSIELRPGVTAVTADRSGMVAVHGPDGPATLSADLVVGADGVHSVVRECGDFGAEVSDRRTDYVRGLVPTEGEEVLAEYWTRLGAFGSAEVAAGVTYFYLGAYRGAAARAVAARDLVALGEAWRAVLPVAAETLDRVISFDQLIVSGVLRVRCRRWFDGRLVLVGDAAHAMAPNAGQGANSAMVDALVLADELDRGGSLPAALERYERRRRRRVRRVQSVADRLATMSGLTSASLVWARDGLLEVAGRVPGLLDSQVQAAQQEDPTALRDTARRLVQRSARPQP